MEQNRSQVTARVAAAHGRRLLRDATSGSMPLTAHIAPHATLGVLVVAASATRAAMNATAADAEILAGTAATCVVIAVVGALVAGRRLADKRSRVRARAFLSVAGGWLTAVTAAGLTLDAVALLTVVGTALSLHWWRQRRITNPPAQEPIEVIAEPDVDLYPRRWADNLGGPGCALPGSRLEAGEAIKAGRRYILRVAAGKQSYSTVLGQLENIRTGLELMPDHDMIVERHPVLAASCLQFTVVTRSPIRTSVTHPGRVAFDPKTGSVDLGPFVDGEGVARWRAYTKDRLWGGYLQGGTGSGKSRMVEGIALALADSQTHPTVIWYADGQGGASSPLLMKHADHKARDGAQFHAMLAGLLLVIQLRQDENALDEAEGFTPAADRPGIVGIVDECHKFLLKLENPEWALECQWMVSTIAREGGKVGVALILASQQSTLDAFGGAGNNFAETIRANLLMGNGVILRSKDANAQQVFKVNVNPSAFPAIAGYAFLVDPEEGARSAPFRGYYVTDETRTRWPGEILWRSLDPAAANSYGREYLRRREIAEEAREAIRRRVAARRAGQVAEPRPTVRAPVGGYDGAEAIRNFGIATFPIWDPAKVVKAAPRREMHDGHRKILAAMEQGHRSPKAIQMATGYTERHVYGLLGELVDEFKVVKKTERGTYEMLARAA